MASTELSNLISTGPESNRSNDVSRGCLLIFLTIYSCCVIVVVSVIFMMSTIHVCRAFYDDSSSSIVLMGIQVYTILFAMIIILVEMEWGTMIRKSLIYHSWVFRGLCYFFVGLIEVYIHSENKDNFEKLVELRAGNAMMIFGCAYTVMGLLYVKKMREYKTTIAIIIVIADLCHNN